MNEEEVKELEKSVRKVIHDLPFDVRGEVMAVELIQNFTFLLANEETPLTIEDIELHPIGIFSRRYAKDVFGVFLDPQNGSFKLRLDLTREGFYDMLPEAVFHQPREKKKEKRLSDMLTTSKRRQRETQMARQFFRPFEDSFYYLKILIELFEREMMSQIGAHLAEQFPFDKEKLPKELINFIPYLPLIYKLRGDIEKASACLSRIFEVPIHIERQSPKELPVPDYLGIPLGEGSLGVNFVLGASFSPELYRFQIQVGPLSLIRLNSFLEGGEQKILLEFLLEYFLPLESDIEVVAFVKGDEPQSGLSKPKGIVNKEDALWVLSSSSPELAYSILGYTTTLNS